MSALGLIQIGLLAWLLFAAIISLLTATLYPRARSGLDTVAPEQRALILRVLCVAPILLGLGLVVLCFLPSVAGIVWPGFDHCPYHHDGHVHFCMIHLPATSGRWIGWAVAGVLGPLFLVQVFRRLLIFRKSHRLLRQLARTSRLDSRLGVWIVDSDVPMAMTVGVLRQRTLFSAGLIRALPPRFLEVIVEHERAHERRRDALWKLITGLLSLAHLPGARRALLADLELACEQTCDEEAGLLLGDRLCVAQALAAVERIRQGTPRLGLVAAYFGGPTLGARVESLLTAPRIPPISGRVARWLPIVAILAGLFLADPLHHLTETIVGLLAK